MDGYEYKLSTKERNFHYGYWRNLDAPTAASTNIPAVI
jgi:hypothetical protein